MHAASHPIHRNVSFPQLAFVLQETQTEAIVIVRSMYSTYVYMYVCMYVYIVLCVCKLFYVQKQNQRDNAF